MAWTDWLPALLGVAGGAAGSFIPGIGTTLGVMGGSALGGLASGAFGKSRSNMPQYMPQSFRGMTSQQLPGGATATQMPRFTPEQGNILMQLLQGGFGGMQNLPTADFEKVKQAATSQFHQDIVPAISERFTAMGAGGQRSGAFQQALGSAGAGLAERLAAMQQGFNMQNRQSEIARLMGMLQMGMQPQFEYGITPPAAGWGTQLAGGVGQGLGSLAPLMAMKYMGL